MLVGIVLVALLLFSAKASLKVAADSSAPGSATSGEGFMRGLPRRFWLYAAVVLLYGIVETLNGNWSTLYLNQQRGVPIQWASLALTAFWAMVTVGRVLAAVISPRVPARWIYLGLPILLIVAFLVISQVSTAIGGLLAFGLAGLACSAFFPLSISFGGEEFPHLTAVISGELIAFYQVGYGIAAFGTGWLLGATHVSLSTIYAGASLVAGVMIVLAFLVIRPQSAKAAKMSAEPKKGKAV